MEAAAAHTYREVARLAMYTEVAMELLVNALLEVHTGKGSHFMLQLPEDAQVALFGIGEGRACPEMTRVLWLEGRGIATLSRAAENLVYDVINDLTSYTQFEYRIDRMYALLRLGAQHGMWPRAVLGLIKAELHRLWWADPTLRQHLLGARGVFERFVVRHRVDFHFADLSERGRE